MEIFKAKLYENLGDIEVVKTNIQNILVPIKIFKYIEQPIFIIYGIFNYGMKVNDQKCIFGSK